MAISRSATGRAGVGLPLTDPPDDAAGLPSLPTVTAPALQRGMAWGWRESGALASGVALTLLTLSCGSRTPSVGYCVEFCEEMGATLESVAWIGGELNCICQFPEE